VHPDKNPAPEARRAFDAVKEAYKLLQDAAARRDFVQQEGDKLTQKLAAERPARGPVRSLSCTALSHTDIVLFIPSQEELLRMKRAREAREADAFADNVRAQALRQAERYVIMHLCVACSAHA